MDCLHPCPALPAARSAAALLGALLALAAPQAQGQAPAAALPVPAAPAITLGEPVRAQVQALAEAAARLAWPADQAPPRVVVQLGSLPPGLKLAPCSGVVPYLPSGTRALGRTRIGLRCAEGGTRWNVSLPVTIELWGQALVAAEALAAGSTLQPQQLRSAEVDLAARPGAAITQAAAVAGRVLARPLAAGQALRQGDLRARQFFQAGETVRIVAMGPGYAVSSEGQAMGAGWEGQVARVRTDSGRVITGVATGARRVEVPL